MRACWKSWLPFYTILAPAVLLWTVPGCRAGDSPQLGSGGEKEEWDAGLGAGAYGEGGDPAACVSESWWTGGDDDSPLMHPGMACIACHRDMDEGPLYTVAGTVFTELDEPDDCNGVPEVVVEITDASGRTWSDATNSAGNFFIKDSAIKFPITARVIDGGVVREMYAPMEHGDCSVCHTASGTQGAPGRVIAP